MKNTFLPAIGALLTLTLFACQQTPSQTPTSKAIGTLELSFDSQSNKAVALVHTGFQTRAVQTNANLTFNPSVFSAQNDTTNNVQYISAKFNVNNLLGSALSDVTLIAYQKTGNMGGTALKNIYNFAGSSIYATNDPTGIAFAQAVKPVNPPTLGGISPNFIVDNTNADLQVFTETELTGLNGAANTAGELSTAGGEYLLPYGFVARSSASSRTLNANTNNAGTINIGIQVPTSNSSLGTGYRFTMTFVIFDAPVTTRVSESLQEQGAGSGATTRSTNFTTNQIAALVGSSLLQTNDKLVNACRVRTAGTAASPIAFLTAAPSTTAGSFDLCFAAAGKRQININAAGTSTANGSEKITAVKLQPDGKIVLAGWSAVSTAAGADFLVMRLNPDGSFDRSFDTDGKATFSVGAGSATDEAHAVVLQSDGKIVLGGCTFCNATTSNFAMIRVNANGSLDTTSFATSGIFTANSAFNNADDITGLALQTVSGVDYIVAAGFAVQNPNANQQGALLRLKVSDGTLDTSFGDTVNNAGYRFFSFEGSAATPLTGTNTDSITGVVVDASNRIIIGGNDSAFTAGVIRFTTTGAWDIKATSSFGTGGVNGVLLSGTSAIVFGGAVPTGGTNGNEFFAMKFNLSSGSLDTTWGNENPKTGRTYITVTANSDTARAGAFQTDGKIILAGRLRTGGGLSTGDTALVRLNTDGTADTTFDTDGIVSVQRQIGNVDEALATAVNAGKIILAGYERINANAPIEDDVFVLQFNP